MMNKQEYDSRIWEIGTLIKLVAAHDTSSICRCATRIKELYEPGDYDLINNEVLYEAYVRGDSI